MDPSAASAPPHHAAQLQLDGDACCTARYDSTQLPGPIASLTEFEEDQFRRLEEEILAAAAASATATTGPGRAAAGARSAAAAAALLRRGRRDRRWQQRILAVAAFKTEGQRRRVFEEDILSVAASVCSEMGSQSGTYSLDESLLQSQQMRRLTQNASGATVGGGGGGGGAGSSSAGHGRWSAPVCARSRGVFTEEDEDVMNLIVGQAPEAAS